MTVDSGARLARLAEELRERELDGLLVANAIDLRYLTGFSGSHGLALIDPPRRSAPDPPTICF